MNIFGAQKKIEIMSQIVVTFLANDTGIYSSKEMVEIAYSMATNILEKVAAEYDENPEE